MVISLLSWQSGGQSKGADRCFVDDLRSLFVCETMDVRFCCGRLLNQYDDSMGSHILGLQFYHKKILMTLAKGIGKPIKVDMYMGRFARVWVKIDLDQPVVGMLRLRETWYKVEYEGLHLLCTGMWWPLDPELYITKWQWRLLHLLLWLLKFQRR